MKQLIVVPRIINQMGEWYQFPLGIAYVSASMKAAGLRVHTLNLNQIPGSVSDIVKDAVRKHGINIVSTGGLTGQYGAIREVLQSAKNAKSGMITIAGGGIITSAPEDAMEALTFADYGVIGEGEIISCDLHRALERGTDIAEVAGVVYRNGDSWVRTLKKPVPVDLDSVPFPDYDGFGLEELLTSVPNIVGMSEYNTLPIITSRSCPYQCTFCFHPSGQKFRQRSLDSVFDEIDYLVRRYGVKYLSIQDELFCHNLDRVKEFCRRIKPYNIRWLAQFRVTDVTPELLAMVKDANCATMAFGVESADNRVLKSMKKQITIEQTERALELVYNAGVGIQGVLIFGDVAETVETAAKTLAWWKDHIRYELQLSAVITYPGTEIYKYARSKGLIKDPVQYIRDGCPLVRLSQMSDQQYAWLFGQLLSLPRLLHKVPRDARFVRVDYDNATVDLAGSCAACGAGNRWEKSRLFILETLTCRHCGRKHVAPIPDEVVVRLNAGIEALARRYGKIAFWGVNSYFYALSERLQREADPLLFYVDKSEVRRGLTISGHVIQPPEVIHSERIRCVIVSVVQYFAGLKKPIADEFPEVERIFSISDLLAPCRT